jgi:hypothetical protein
VNAPRFDAPSALAAPAVGDLEGRADVPMG